MPRILRQPFQALGGRTGDSRGVRAFRLRHSARPGRTARETRPMVERLMAIPLTIGLCFTLITAAEVQSASYAFEKIANTTGPLGA